MSDKQADLRSRLRDIRNNPHLSSAEKSKRSQELMMQNVTCPSQIDVLVSNHAESCEHYDKLCSGFFFDCCQVIDPCHRCHMARECCDTKPPAISTVLCNKCGTRQPPSQTCSSCNTKFSHSYCAICKIWTAADIHHCDGCGFCRVGKAEDIFHCENCEACFSRSTQALHVCAKTKLKGEMCPLCLESVHSSTKSSTILTCGHVVHVDCWRSSYQQGDYRCPTCRKSLFNMQPYWLEMRLSIALQPIPPGFFPISPGDRASSPMGPFLVHSVSAVPRGSGAREGGEQEVMCSGDLVNWQLANGRPATASFRRSALRKDTSVDVLCYDCGERCRTAFHFLGLECKACGSFNTARA